MSEFDDEYSVVTDAPVPLSPDRATREIDPRELIAGGALSWPVAMASLERIDTQAIYAFRLGVLTLLQECGREMAHPEASAALVSRARMLVELLAKMPWETP